MTTESALTPEKRAELEKLDNQLLGNLGDADQPSEVAQLAAELGVPVPAWFRAGATTISDVNQIGIELRRPR